MGSEVLHQEELNALLGLNDAEEVFDPPQILVEEALPGIFVIMLKDELYIGTRAQEYISALQLRLPILDGHLVFDLSPCRYVSSLTLGFWASLVPTQREKGKTVSLVGANPKMRKLIDMLNLDQLLYVFDTMDECFATLKEM